MTAPLGVGIVGFGHMGRTHLASYVAAAAAGVPCRVVAVTSRKAEGLAGAKIVSEPREVFEDPRVDVVSVCTPTDSHAELAMAALAAGKHVLVEKPVALEAAEIRRVADAAKRAGKLCMPAMCMRFWPGWRWLRDRIVDRSFGAVRSATFRRLSSPPGWSPKFYSNLARSGGALTDLHIHDADFVAWCFGIPDGTESTGTLDHVTTLYQYRRGPAHVVAEGGWDHTPGFAFRMAYVVVFERATAEFDNTRSLPLTLARDGRTEPVPIERGAGYDGEVRHFLETIASGGSKLDATLEEAAAVADLLAAERRGLGLPD